MFYMYIVHITFLPLEHPEFVSFQYIALSWRRFESDPDASLTSRGHQLRVLGEVGRVDLYPVDGRIFLEMSLEKKRENT